MSDSDTTNSLSRKFNRIKSELDERGCRLWAASEAMELGHGGIKAVAKATAWGRGLFGAAVKTCGKKPGHWLVSCIGPGILGEDGSR